MRVKVGFRVRHGAKPRAIVSDRHGVVQRVKLGLGLWLGLQ